MEKILVREPDDIFDNFDGFIEGRKKGLIRLPVTAANILEWYKEDTAYPAATGITKKNMEKIIYYSVYIILDPGETDLRKGQVLTEKELKNAVEKHGEDSFVYGTGAGALKKYIDGIDFKEKYNKIRKQEEKIIKIILGLGEYTEDEEDNDPEKFSERIRTRNELDSVRALGDAVLYAWMKHDDLFIDEIRLFPVQMRSILSNAMSNRYNGIAHDIESLCASILTCGERIGTLTELKAPDIIIRNEKRILQENIDNYIYNGLRKNSAKKNGGSRKYSLADAVLSNIEFV